VQRARLNSWLSRCSAARQIGKIRLGHIKPFKKWGIPGAEAYPLDDDIQVMPLQVAMRELAYRRVD
jgi:hypothetical protein